MVFGPESPKYLVAQGRHEEALKVLEIIYNGNHPKKAGMFPVSSTFFKKYKLKYLFKFKFYSIIYKKIIIKK